MQGLRKSVMAMGWLLAGPAMAAEDVHLVLTAGLSAGGDTVAEAIFADGETEKIKGGGLIYGAFGPSLEFTGTPWSAQVLVGRHFDDISASNGKMEFKRDTLDVQLFYRAGDHRFGLGLVNHRSPEYKQSGSAIGGLELEFKDATGAAFEYNWLPVGSALGFSLRAVTVDYELDKVDGFPASSPDKLSGDHVAVGLYVYL